MLISILQNLVSNAIRHSHAGGQVTLSANQDEEMMVICIKDSSKACQKK
jgi:two-component system CheB/CheR fusion protein